MFTHLHCNRPGDEFAYDARYILRYVCSLLAFTAETENFHRRPETVESLFLAYRLTGDQRYRDYGWSIFQAIETYCRIETGGYASILNVDAVPVTYEDKMETFLMVSSYVLLHNFEY